MSIISKTMEYSLAFAEVAGSEGRVSMNQVMTNKQPQASVREKSTYTVQEISVMLGISLRSAYNLCDSTSDFKVLRIGRSVRVHKGSFDGWFHACVGG